MLHPPLLALVAATLLPAEAHGFVPAPAHGTLPRRAVLLGTPAAAVLTAAAPPAAALSSLPFEHSLTSVDIAGAVIPVAVWRPRKTAPTTAAPPPPPPYPYKIDIGKIAAKLRVGWLSWLPTFDYALPCGAVAAAPLLSSDGSGFGRARDGDAILFAHGFLGSVYDFAHAAEALAADGFTVIAPELPESLCASYIPPDGLGREEIIAAARELVGAEEGARWGIFGHSAGAGSSLLQPGEYRLGRAAFAGGAGRIARYASRDPLFLCSSNGDGCNRFMGLGADADLRPLLTADDGPTTTTLFTSLDEAYASPREAPPPRGAFVFADDNSPAPLPSHISFLWSEVDDAMVSLLSPLLPLAKALGLFLLDFDVYRENRDAERTAAALVPALRRFFLVSSAR